MLIYLPVIGIIPNFAGFLGNMGVHVHDSTTKAYYFAYPIGLFLSFFSYWVFNYFYPPALSFPMSEWREPKDYVRPEERGETIEGRGEDMETGGVEEIGGEKYGEKGNVRVNLANQSED